MLYCHYGNAIGQGGYPPQEEGLSLRTKERRVRHMYVTYAELIQLLIFIVALVGLFYAIYKDKK